MAEVFIGQIIQGAWNFAPQGFHICDGSLLNISQSNALFALLSTTFGGDGRTTFGLPDLRGRAPVGTGTAPSGTTFTLGQAAGSETAQLTVQNLPPHTHAASFAATGSSLNVAATKATLQTPAAGAVLGRSVDGATGGTSVPQIYCPAGTDASIALAGLNMAGTVNVEPAGEGQRFSVMSPVLPLTSVIALTGIFPMRP